MGTAVNPPPQMPSLFFQLLRQTDAPRPALERPAAEAEWQARFDAYRAACLPEGRLFPLAEGLKKVVTWGLTTALAALAAIAVGIIWFLAALWKCARLYDFLPPRDGGLGEL